MKKISDVWLPDGDQHFQGWFGKLPRGGHGRYQFDRIEAAMAILPADRRRTAIDVGAHVGLFTVPLAGMFDRVEAFEPVWENFLCLEKNAGGKRGVRLHDMALSDRAGVATAQRPKADNSGSWRLEMQPRGQAYMDGMVPVLALDGYAFKAVDLVKVDVQGMDLEVLRGGQLTLAAWRPVVIVEDTMGDEAGPCEAFLAGLGAVRHAKIRRDVVMYWKD